MNRRSEAILSILPEVVQTPRGWFAVSPPTSAIHVGVTGTTELEARERFTRELQAWASLAERPNRPVTPSESYVP